MFHENPFAPQELREIPNSEVTRTKSSDISVMLPDLIKSFKKFKKQLTCSEKSVTNRELK